MYNVVSTLTNIGIVIALIALIIVSYKITKYIVDAIKKKAERKNTSVVSMLIVVLKIGVATLIITASYYIIKTLYPDIALTLTAAVTATYFLGIVLGLAAQSSLGNVIAGVILVFSQAVKVGDLVEYEKEVALVEDVKLTHTILRLRDGRRIAIPNSNMLNSHITNYNMIDELVAATVSVGISYESNLEDAIKAMMEAALENNKVLKKPPPQVMITGFGDFSINLKLLAWINDPWIKPIIESDLISSIYEKFKKYNVEIPYPRRVVIMKSSEHGETMKIGSEGLKGEVKAANEAGVG